MNAAVLPTARDAMLPRPQDGLGIGAVLAVIAHLLLVAALAFSVNWRTHEPESVVAELWSAVPQVAGPRETRPPPEPVVTPPRRPAPPPQVAPEPPRVDAQIAIEKARRDDAKREETRREEARREDSRREKDLRAAQARERSLAESARRERAAQQAEADLKKAAETARKEEAALLAQREANLKRMQGQATANASVEGSGTAARNSGPSSGYGGRIKARIRPNIVFNDSGGPNTEATVEVRCAPDGSIVSRKLVRSSGNPAWDEAVLRAIDKTETLPRDTDGRVPPLFELGFKPRD